VVLSTPLQPKPVADPAQEIEIEEVKRGQAG
jgi:hypothetical protein